jgi:hypothetical protein
LIRHKSDQRGDKSGCVTYLDGRLVLGEGVKWRHLVTEGRVPDVEHVVVAAAGEVASVGGPREAAHLLRVTGQCGHVVICHAHVVVVDLARACAAVGEKQSFIYCDTGMSHLVLVVLGHPHIVDLVSARTAVAYREIMVYF